MKYTVDMIVRIDVNADSVEDAKRRANGAFIEVADMFGKPYDVREIIVTNRIEDRED